MYIFHSQTPCSSPWRCPSPWLFHQREDLETPSPLRVNALRIPINSPIPANLARLTPNLLHPLPGLTNINKPTLTVLDALEQIRRALLRFGGVRQAIGASVERVH